MTGSPRHHHRRRRRKWRHHGHQAAYTHYTGNCLILLGRLAENTGKRFALGDRHGKPRFVESIASRQDLRRCGLCEEEVHDVEESTNAVRVGWTDRDESDWYTASNPDRILSVQVLCKRVKESMRQELESYLKDTYSLNTSLSGRLRVRTTVEGLKTKCGRRGKIRTEGPEETLKRKGHVN